jgi:hypothetical protein
MTQLAAQLESASEACFSSQHVFDSIQEMANRAVSESLHESELALILTRIDHLARMAGQCAQIAAHAASEAATGAAQ